MKYAIVAAISMLLTALVVIASPVTAQPPASDRNLYLRRATFDPLRAPQASASANSDSLSRLLLMQFDSVPTAETRTKLAAAGYQPLLYVPINALLVRAAEPQPRALAALPELRWSGAYQAGYKLASGLDSAVSGQQAGELDLRLVATPDADLDALTRALEAAGGTVQHRGGRINGAVLRLRLPATALRAALERDDVVWVEPAFTPTLTNDRARAIVGVPAARERYGWLTGAGQIIAVTDTGLDVQQSVEANGNPDFKPGRIVAAFSPAQMSSSCAGLQNGASWSDRNGHGTHVAGTALGGGRLFAEPPLAGMAPGARLVVQAVSSGGDSLDCLDEDNSFLLKAYNAGARIQNGSWGQPTGSGFLEQYGGYTSFEQMVDEFLWSRKEHLFVVVAGNSGVDDDPPAGVTDPDSIESPGTAKNVLTVGASENYRPPTSPACAIFGSSSMPENQCYGTSYGQMPIAGDFVSDNINGIAAFSARGPTDDGRIKPEIVAPGTNIVSTASHSDSAFYAFGKYNANYAYSNGTSMSAPMISGLAALTRQWLAEARQIARPSAALVKALLLNGARDLSPGQYGAGAQREIPPAWPNSAEGWGRAAISDSIGLNGNQAIWLADERAGLLQGGSATYQLQVGAGAPLRISLAWTDYPASPISGRALVNDLDLEVQAPGGPLLRGNAAADLAPICRDAASGADRCNNVESLEIAAPEAGVYTVHVRGAAAPLGPQPFALAAHAREIGDTALGAPALQAIGGGGPLLELSWSAVAGATFYQIEQSDSSDFEEFTHIRTTMSARLDALADGGTHWFRVRACTAAGCGSVSNLRLASVTIPPKRYYLQLTLN